MHTAFKLAGPTGAVPPAAPTPAALGSGPIPTRWAGSIDSEAEPTGTGGRRSGGTYQGGAGSVVHTAQASADPAVVFPGTGRDLYHPAG